MVARQRRPTDRDERRRRLGQNFLLPERAERFADEAALRPGELVLEVGAGSGSVTRALVRRNVDVVAVEVDPDWANRLRQLFGRDAREEGGRVRIVEADFSVVRLPERPFRVVSCLPFGETTSILHRLLDDPRSYLERADVIVQHEVAVKRSAAPPSTLLSTVWAPWWEFRRGAHLPGTAFRPVPRTDAGVLVVTRRRPPLLPAEMAGAYARFVRSHWPFPRDPAPPAPVAPAGSLRFRPGRE